MKKQTVAGGYKVKVMPDRKMYGYAGMNYYAAKVLGFHPVPNKHQIIVDRIYKGVAKRQVEKHEVEEAHLMSHGMPYFQAHKIATKHENKPWPHWTKDHYSKNKSTDAFDTFMSLRVPQRFKTADALTYSEAHWDCPYCEHTNQYNHMTAHMLNDVEKCEGCGRKVRIKPHGA